MIMMAIMLREALSVSRMVHLSMPMFKFDQILKTIFRMC
jgi:hypothetical protein